MSQLTPAQRVAAYVQLRDYKAAAEKEFDKSMEKVNLAMQKLEAELLGDLNAAGVNNMACDAGSVYRSTQLSATVENREAFRRGKSGLVQACVFHGDRSLVRKGAGQFDLGQAETNRFALMDKDQGAQITAAHEGQDQQGPRSFSQEAL